MHEITALELGLAVMELRQKVVGSYLKKFYDLGNGSFRFSLHNSGGNFVLYCNLLSSFNETRFVEEAGAATNFAIAVRRRVEDSKITDLYQHGGDRIAVMEVQAKGARHRIVFEMFGKGNLILIDDVDDIELCYRVMLYKDREVKPRIKYIFPKSGSVEIEKLDSEKMESMLSEVSKAEGKMITELSKYLNVGPIYLEDIITSAGLNPKDRMSEKDIEALKKSVTEFLRKIEKPSPRIYTRDGKIVDYSVVPLKRYQGEEYEEMESISKMLDEVNIGKRSEVGGTGMESEVNEIEAVIAKQNALVKDFADNSVKYAAEGRRIFERMNEINALINRIKQNKRITLEELKSEFPELNITEISLKDRKITIDV